MKKRFISMFLVVSCFVGTANTLAYGIENEVAEVKTEVVAETVNVEEINGVIEVEPTLDVKVQGKEKSIKNEKDFKYINKNSYIGTLKDEKGATRKLTNIGLRQDPKNKNAMSLVTKLADSSRYNKDEYIFQEIYIPTSDGKVKFINVGAFNVLGYDTAELYLNAIPKEQFKKSRYFYIRTCTVKSIDAEYCSDAVTYKIDNPFYDGFTDIKGHFAEKQILDFAKKGYTNGYSDKTFRPNNPITRAEFVKFTNKVFGLKTKASSEKFTDVNSSNWYYNEVLIALKAGYITEKNKAFRPNDPITREEVASIITTLTNSKDTKIDKLNKYRDKSKVSKWALSSVEGAIEKGYMGKGSDTFRPKDKITRGEAVATLARIATN